LQVEDDPADFLQREALVQELIPLPLPHKVQAQLLPGKLAVELVRLGDLCRSVHKL